MRQMLAFVAGTTAAALVRRGLGDELVEVLARDHGDEPGYTESAPGDVLRDGSPLDGLGPAFGLSRLELALLAVAVAPEVDAALGVALGVLDGRTVPGRASVSRALELVGVPTASPDARLLLGPWAPLVQQGLLAVEGDGPFLQRALHVPDRVVAHLLGDDDPSPALALVTTVPVPVASTEAVVLARAVEAGAPLSWVRSPSGAAGAATAAGAFEHLRVGALCVELGRVSDPAGLAPVLVDAAREAGLRGDGLVVLGLDVLRTDGVDAPALVGLLARAAVPVVGVARTSFDPGWSELPVHEVEARPLGRPQRADLWRGLVPDVDLAASPGWPELLGLRLLPEQVTAAVERARLAAAALAVPLSVDLLRETVRTSGSGAATPGLVMSRPRAHRTTVSDLVLPEPVLAEVERLIRWATHRDRVVATGSIHGRGTKGSGLAALFTGGPGTGKTLAATVVSDALGLELVQVDLSTVVDKYIGETEKNLERVFDQAEARNGVLFFDEADALFGSRSEVRDSKDRYANQGVSYLLQRMEQHDGVSILATNLRGNLDKAFMRRMQLVLHFPDPDAATRRRLWERHLAEVGVLDPGDPVDLDVLVTVEVAGGDIRNVVLGAAYDALGSGEAVGMRHLTVSLQREFAKLGRRRPEV